MSYIRVESLSKRFDTHVLDNVEFTVKKNEFVSIIGPFGSGKSTILRIMSGLDLSYDGKVELSEMAPHELKKTAAIGFAFQQSTLMPWLSAYENITLPCRLYRKHECNEFDVNNLIEAAGLTRYKHMPVAKLSGGTRQLASILRALVLNPKILFLDEPFSSIDEISRMRMHDTIKKLHKDNQITTLMVTHSIHEAVVLSDKVLVLGGLPATIMHEIDTRKATKDNPKELVGKTDLLMRVLVDA